jgi:hypothetical protein
MLFIRLSGLKYDLQIFEFIQKNNNKKKTKINLFLFLFSSKGNNVLAKIYENLILYN